ncbi:MAG: hypothetical protein JRI25_26955, partial [Deltaproteobacteria bacterium]|nr:hypothetical protein [Deltaproteobacteria bacterium]
SGINTCRASIDEPERLTWMNPDDGDGDDDTVTAYAIVDLYNSGSEGRYNIDVEIFPLNPGQDDCGAADTAGALTTGEHELVGRFDADGVNSDYDSSCSSQSPGPDVVAKVLIEEGEALWAHLVGDEADTVLYLLAGCGDADTCLASADLTYTGETIVYPNLDNGDLIDDALTAYLVLDSFNSGDSGMYDAAVEIWEIDTLDPTVQYDDPCTTTPAPLTTGYHLLQWGDTSTYSNTVSGSTCAALSSDGFDLGIPLTLEDGQTLTVWARAFEADAQLYLTETCGSAATCLTWSDGPNSEDPEMFEYTNDSVSIEDLFLTLDADTNYGPPDGPFVMDILIQ